MPDAVLSALLAFLCSVPTRNYGLGIICMIAVFLAEGRLVTFIIVIKLVGDEADFKYPIFNRKAKQPDRSWILCGCPPPAASTKPKRHLLQSHLGLGHKPTPSSWPEASSQGRDRESALKEPPSRF